MTLPELVRSGAPETFERVAPRFVSRDMALLDHVCVRREDPRPATMPGPALGFVRSGLAQMQVEASSFLADCNQLVLMNSGVDYLAGHRGCRNRDCATTLLLSAELVAEALESLDAPGVSPGSPFPQPVVPRPVELSLLHYRLLAASREGGDPLEAEELALEALALALATAHERSSGGGIEEGRTRPGDARLADRARGFLAASFRRQLTLSDAADAAGCSRFHLCRTFKSVTGLTLTRYLHRIRLGYALERLYRGEEDISRLAVDLGYSTHSHFTSVFRRQTGTTPSELRAQMRGA